MAADSRNHYELLGVPPTASPQEIKQAYRNLARQYHPDVRPNDSAAEDLFKQINAAYQVLSDPLQRARYDRQERTRWGVPNAYAAAYGTSTTTYAAHPPNKIPVKLLFFAIGFVLVMSIVMTIVLVAFTPTPNTPKTVEQYDRELTETVVARRIAAIGRMPTHTPAPEFLRQAWIWQPDIIPTPEYALPVIECTINLTGQPQNSNDCEAITVGSEHHQSVLKITLNGYRRVQFEVQLAEQGPFDFAIQDSSADEAAKIGVFGDDRLAVMANPPLPETDTGDPIVTAGQTLLIEITDQRVAWWMGATGEEILSRYLFALGRATDNGNQNENADLVAVFNSGVAQVTVRLYSPVLIRTTASPTPISP